MQEASQSLYATPIDTEVKVTQSRGGPHRHHAFLGAHFQFQVVNESQHCAAAFHSEIVPTFAYQSGSRQGEDDSLNLRPPFAALRGELERSDGVTRILGITRNAIWRIGAGSKDGFLRFLGRVR